MEPISIPEELKHPEVPIITFAPPEGHEHVEGLENCGSLETQIIEGVLVSYWKLSEEELELVNKGQPIVLGCWGTQIPVSLGVLRLQEPVEENICDVIHLEH